MPEDSEELLKLKGAVGYSVKTAGETRVNCVDFRKGLGKIL